MGVIKLSGIGDRTDRPGLKTCPIATEDDGNGDQTPTAGVVPLARRRTKRGPAHANQPKLVREDFELSHLKGTAN